jgi:hypothetical protein
MSRTTGSLVFVASMACAGTALAQGIPTSQPNLLQIYREEVKVGRAAEHAKFEAGWPAAYEKTKNPYTYIALASMTGPGEVWFVSPFTNHQAMADMFGRDDDPSMAPILERLQRGDADYISSTRSILAAARKDLSHGAYPDTAKQRFYEITIFSVKPGHGRDFEAAAKAYGAAATRSAPDTSYRVYEVLAGLPSPTFLVFSSVTSYAAFDKVMADGQAISKAMTEEERGTMAKFTADGLARTEVIRFRLSPTMSYVTQEVKAQDPAFWSPRPSAVNASAKPASTKPAAKPAVNR